MPFSIKEKKGAIIIIPSLILLIGMAIFNVFFMIFAGILIFIIGFLLFEYFSENESKYASFHFKALSENSIKIILAVIMIAMLIIPPISSPTTIILWTKIELLNYLRAIVFLVGLTYLPGACLYNIFFHENNLHEKFNVEPFLLKITLYPLLSFSFIGISVLLLDQIGLIQETITLLLFLIILELLILDLFIQKYRGDKIKFSSETIEISTYTLAIVIITIGLGLAFFGLTLYTQYLTPKHDNWAGIQPAFYIGRLNISQISDRLYFSNYPTFFGNTIFGLSVLSGLPYVNTYVILMPINYVYILSAYLMMKVILSNFKEKQVVLATILMIILNHFYYVYYDIYKNYSHSLLFICVALFFIITRNYEIEVNPKLGVKKTIKIGDLKLLILGALLITLSYMTYMFPLLIGFIFIFLYCLFSEKSKKLQNFKVLTKFTFLVIIFFIIFDISMNYYLSYIAMERFLIFFQFELMTRIFEAIPIQYIVYSILIGFFISCVFIQYLLLKFFKKNDKRKYRFKINSKIVFNSFFVLLTFLLIIEIISVIINLILPDIDIINTNFFLYYLDKLFWFFGLFGTVPIYLSYHFFKQKKQLFNILISWVVFLIVLGSVLIYLQWIVTFPSPPQDLSVDLEIFMSYWFRRISVYAGIPLAAIGSIGIFEYGKNLGRKKIFNKNNKFNRKGSQYLIISMILCYMCSYNIIRLNTYSYLTDDEVQVLSWMSENIPPNSGLLMEDNFELRRGIETMTYYGIYNVSDYFKKGDYSQAEYNNTIDLLKENYIQYILYTPYFISEHNNGSLFINNFYNATLYQCGHFNIAYAPYFD